MSELDIWYPNVDNVVYIMLEIKVSVGKIKSTSVCHSERKVFSPEYLHQTCILTTLFLLKLNAYCNLGNRKHMCATDYADVNSQTFIAMLVVNCQHRYRPMSDTFR